MNPTMQAIISKFETSEHWKTYGVRCLNCSPEQVILELPYQEMFANVRGMIHGGVMMSLMDTAMGMHGVALGHAEVMTISFQTNFVQGAKEERLIAKTSLVTETRSTALLQCHLTNDQNELIAFANATFRTLG